MRYFLCKGCEDESEDAICKLRVLDAELHVVPEDCPFGCPTSLVDWAEVTEDEYDDEI